MAVGGLLWRPGIRAVRAEAPRRWLRIAGGTLLVAAVIAVVYERIAGFAPSFGISPLLDSLHQGIRQLPPVLHDAVGTFEYLNVHLPPTAYWIWWALVLCMVAAAMVVGTRRERVFVAVVTLLGLAFPVLFYAWIDRFTGFGLQGREVLPALMLIPLFSGEIISRHRAVIAHASMVETFARRHDRADRRLPGLRVVVRRRPSCREPADARFLASRWLDSANRLAVVGPVCRPRDRGDAGVRRDRGPRRGQGSRFCPRPRGGRSESGQDHPEPISQLNRRLPAELALGPGDVEAAPFGPRPVAPERTAARASALAGHLVERREQVEHRGLPPAGRC